VKVTRPAADLSRESVAYRLERLEQRAPVPSSHAPGSDPGTGPAETIPAASPPAAAATPEPPDVELEQLQEAWQRTILPAVEERGGIPTAAILREAHPSGLDGDTLTLEFPRTAEFHLHQAEEPRHATMLADALYEVTGRRLSLAFALGTNGESEARHEPEEPAGEERILEMLTETLDAREREQE
jgi:hypothetical protein